MGPTARERMIFIHVPKCAGTSIKALMRTWGFQRARLDTHVEDIRSGFYKRGTAAWMRHYAEPDEWAQSFKFAVCRNPYDRLFSGWSFCRKQDRLNVPFDYFVRHLRTFRTYWIDWHCVMSQRQHLLIDGACVTDYVCRFEHLEEDFDVVRKKLGKQGVALPRLNQSSRRSYRTQFTKELQDLTFEMFADDFEYFGYGYDL